MVEGLAGERMEQVILEYKEQDDKVFMQLGDHKYEFEPAQSFLETFLTPMNVFGIRLAKLFKHNREQDKKQAIAEAERIIREAKDKE